jgi:lipoprotein-anchoring transpeptidase ErfK/SrfK
MNKSTISRRRLIKLSSGILAAAPFVRVSAAHAAEEAQLVAAPTSPALHPLGRAFYRGSIFAQASNKSKAVGKFKAGEIIAITGQTEGAGLTDYNQTWYEVAIDKSTQGFVHSSMVQPCDNVLNKPLTKIDERGIWGEITVPIAPARNEADPKAGQRFPAYYSLLVRIVGVREGADKKLWYEIKEDKWSKVKANSFILAEQVRIVDEAEFSTISPNVPEAKSIIINLKSQSLVAYEDEVPVFHCRLASGQRGYDTPVGEHWIYVKTPGQRMFGGAAGDDSAYDLPAIPWVSYFTPVGHSFHGTYWHNDYGRPRSHGCANLTPEDAKWIFRWSLPIVDYYAEDGFSTIERGTKREERGTKVTVVQE